jgi:hypothetical protein
MLRTNMSYLHPSHSFNHNNVCLEGFNYSNSVKLKMETPSFGEEAENATYKIACAKWAI